MTVIFGLPEWECPNCMTVHRGVMTPGQPFLHNCPGLSGLTAPLVPKGQRCKVEAKEREDYVGSDTVTYDSDGKAISSVEVTRDEGNDVVVQAPCVNVRMEM